MTQRNTPERADMLARRRRDQLSRVRHPGNLITAKVAKQTTFSPSINRHTGKPHEHLRARRRYLKQARVPA